MPQFRILVQIQRNLKLKVSPNFLSQKLTFYAICILCHATKVLTFWNQKVYCHQYRQFMTFLTQLPGKIPG